MKKIALLGITYYEKCKAVIDRLEGNEKNKCSDKNKIAVWGWTYKLTPKMIEELRRQKTFKIYAYNSNKAKYKAARQKIIHCFNVYDFVYDDDYMDPPDPELVVYGPDDSHTNRRGYYYINGYGTLKPTKKWNEFNDYKYNKVLQGPKQNPNIKWPFVLDEFECDGGIV